MPSRALSLAVVGTAAFVLHSASVAFISAAGARALRGAPDVAAGASYGAAGRFESRSCASLPLAACVVAAAAAAAAQAGKRGARRSVQARAVGTLERPTAAVAAAKKDYELKKWAANQLATKGAPQAAELAQRAQAAEALWRALEAEASGKPAAPASYTPPPAASAPVPAPAAVPTPMGAVTTAAVAAAKKDYDLKKWAANQLATKGAPQAAAAAQRAQAAEAQWRALEAAASGKPAAPASYTPPPAASAPAPAAVPTPMGAVTTAAVTAAKKDYDLKKWAANQLATKGAPQAAAAAQRAQAAEAQWRALEAAASGKPAAPASYTPPPAASAPAPVPAPATPMGAVSAAELKEAKVQADRLTWAAQTLAEKGAPQAAMMQSKATQAVAAYNELLRKA